MTQKERFVQTLKFRPVDRVPFMEIALWGQTQERWENEGLPPEIPTGLMKGCAYFGLEGYENVALDFGPRPPFASQVLEENEETILFTDEWGRTRKARKTGTVRGTRRCMDQYLEFPVRDRASLRAMQRRFQGEPAVRYPSDWEAVVARVQDLEQPLTILDPLSGTFGYYSMLRNWIGTEPLSYLFYDDPGLIEEGLECLTEFILQLFTRALQEVRFDFYYIHEDLAGKGGPLIGPQLFRRFLLPHYQRFVGFLKAQGVEIVLVDTDGDFEVLIPLFLEAGIDGFGPMEVAASMDPVRIRQQYGSSFSMVGGIDKRELAQGKAAIDAQIRHVIQPLIETGGFIPTIDHSVPPEVSLSNFQYYLEQKWKAIQGETV